MCGRFTLTKSLNEIIERFHIANMIDSYTKRYNIAPSQNVIAVVHDGKQNRIGFLKWGLVPSWSKDPSIGHKMINARCETIADKPSFRLPFLKKRCLIIADGFYEWKRTDNNTKIPTYIHLQDHSLFAMAGLWERHIDDKGNETVSCTVVTTTPNELMAPIHNRMPVILHPQEEAHWINQSFQNTERLHSLLKPYPSEFMQAYEVANEVNSPKNEGEQLILPI